MDYKPSLRERLRNLFPPYSSSDTVFGVSIYGSPHYEKPWFRWTFRAAHRLLGRIDAVYYWFHYRIRRYDIVRTDLGYRYADVDERMFRACFALLGEFVEKELGRKLWFGDEGDLYRGYRLHSVGGTDEKAIDLWLWYKEELPKIEEDYARDVHEVYDGSFSSEPTDNDSFRRVVITQNREPKYPFEWPEIVKEEKLRELIDLRRALWT